MIFFSHAQIVMEDLSLSRAMRIIDSQFLILFLYVEIVEKQLRTSCVLKSLKQTGSAHFRHMHQNKSRVTITINLCFLQTS